MLSAYGPVFAYAAVAIVLVLILTVAFRHAQVNQSLLALGAVMVLGYGFLAVFLVSNVAKALRTGILVDGEVIAGPKLRVSIKGQTRDIVLNARRSYPTGARLNVMIDPAKQTVLLLLGSAP